MNTELQSDSTRTSMPAREAHCRGWSGVRERWVRGEGKQNGCTGGVGSSSASPGTCHWLTLLLCTLYCMTSVAHAPTPTPHMRTKAHRTPCPTCSMRTDASGISWPIVRSVARMRSLDTPRRCISASTVLVTALAWQGGGVCGGRGDRYGPQRIMHGGPQRIMDGCYKLLTLTGCATEHQEPTLASTRHGVLAALPQLPAR